MPCAEFDRLRIVVTTRPSPRARGHPRGPAVIALRIPNDPGREAQKFKDPNRFVFSAPLDDPVVEVKALPVDRLSKWTT